MPHLTLELSANLADTAPRMLDTAVAVCQESGHFELAVLMARCVLHEHFRVAQQGATAFANLTLRIRPGRSTAVRAALTRRLADSIAGVLDETRPNDVTCITCEVQEVDVETRTLLLTGARR